MEKRTRGAVSLLACAAAALALFQPALRGNVFGGHGAARPPFRTPAPELSGIYDVEVQMLPYLCFTRRELSAGRMPLWNPWGGGGAPFLANQQSAVLHPFTLLATLLPFRRALVLLAFLRFLLAYGGAWLLARDLGAGHLGRSVAAIAFSLSGVIVTWICFPMGGVLAHFPLVLALARRHARMGGLLHAGCLSTILASSILTGHYEYLPVLWLSAAGVWAGTALSARTRTRAWLQAAAAFVLAPLLGAATLLPAIEYLAQGTQMRGRLEIERAGPRETRIWPALVDGTFLHGMPPHESLFSTMFFGSLGLTLAFGGSALSRGRLVALLALLALALFVRSPLSRLFWSIPPFSLVNAYRLVAIPILCLALLAGLCADALARGALPLRSSLLGLAACAFALSLERLLYDKPPSAHPFVWLAGGLLALALGLAVPRIRAVARTVPAFLLMALLVEHALAIAPMTRWERPERLFPSSEPLTRLRDLAGHDRFLAAGSYLLPAIATIYEIRDARLYDSIGVFAYDALQAAERDFSILGPRRFVPSPASRLEAARVLVLPWEPPANEPPLELLSLSVPGHRAALDPKALPRARLLSAPSRRDAVSFAMDLPTRIVLRCLADSPDRLVLADSYYQGWRARIDGRPVPIAREGAFRAIDLPPGTHEVDLAYAPASYRIGLFLTLLSVAGSATTAAISRSPAPRA